MDECPALRAPRGSVRDRHTYVHKHSHLITHTHASLLTQPLARSRVLAPPLTVSLVRPVTLSIDSVA